MEQEEKIMSGGPEGAGHHDKESKKEHTDRSELTEQAPLMTRKLLDWYDHSRRILPWREDPTPYHVWVSEIMLQQTRVETVIDYYLRFMEKFPDIQALAAAEEDDYLKTWEGLGYYSRVRNLHKAAGIIVQEFDGRMPDTSEELRQLPGIGPYTSAAIASIAFGEPTPAIDGNLLRIFARVSLYDKNIKASAAASAAAHFYQTLMPAQRSAQRSSGDLNQALMDLGAMICKPGEQTKCAECPWQTFCKAFEQGKAADLPVMPEKKARRRELRTILLIHDSQRVLLHKRPKKGLLAGLYEFPCEKGALTEDEALAAARRLHVQPLHIRRLPPAKHLFSHIEWDMTGYEIRIDELALEESGPGRDNADKGDERDSEKFRKGYFLATRDDLTNRYSLPSAFSAYYKILMEKW